MMVSGKCGLVASPTYMHEIKIDYLWQKYMKNPYNKNLQYMVT